MQLYPAIDIKEEKCARLTQGLSDQVKICPNTPSDMAKLWVEKGTSLPHLADLDGALAGPSVNEGVIRSIMQTVSMPVQIGGGIRNRGTVQCMLNLGVTRVIIGTKAVQNPEFTWELMVGFGSEHIVVGVDVEDDTMTIEGQEKMSSISTLDLCKQMKEYSIRHIVYTDVARDGMLLDLDTMMTKKLMMETDMDITTSGGISSMEDLCQPYEEGIGGAIIGKALCERRIDLGEAAACFRQNP